MAEDVHKVKTIFEAHTEKFKKAIDSALKTIERFEKVSKTIEAVTLDADASRLNEVVDRVNARLEALEHEKATALIDAENKVTEKVDNAKIALDFINNKRANAFLDLNDRLFSAKVAKVKAEVAKLDHSNINIALDVDNGLATAKVIAFKARLRSIPNRIKSKIIVDVDNKKSNIFALALKKINDRTDVFNQRMDALAKSIRTFGAIGQSMLRGVMLSSFSALIPIIASAIPVIMAVGNALGVVAGGALGVAGAFSVAGVGLVGFGLMAKTATKMLEKGTIAASEATFGYQAALKNLKLVWQSIIRQNATHIFGAMRNALNGVTSAVQQLEPFLSGIASVVDKNAESMKNWIQKSGTAKKAFKEMNTTGVKIFSNLLSAVGRFGDGLINIFTQFMPLFKFMSQGFQNMAIDFQKWANKVSTEKGIQRFIAYTEKNLPVIGKIFGDTFIGIINLFRAFSGNSQDLFQSLSEMTGRFKAWSEAVGQSENFKKFISYVQQNGPMFIDLIGNVASALINFATAMAPIGQVVLGLITKFAGFVAELFKTHPAVAQVIGVLITFGGVLMTWIPTFIGVLTYLSPLISRFGFLKTTMLLLSRVFTLLSGPIGLVAKLFPFLGSAIAFLTSPIGLVIGAIVALIAIFTILWNKNEAFRNFIINMWNSIKTFFIDLWTDISLVASVLWDLLLTTIVNVLIGAITWITTTWQNILTFLTELWNSIVTLATFSWNLLVTIIETVITTIWDIQQSIWNAIFNFLSTLWDTVVSIASTVWNTLVTVITTVLEKVKTFVSNTFNKIVSTLTSTMTKVYNTIKEKVQNAYDAVTEFIDKFKEAGHNLIMGLVDGVVGAASDLIEAVKGAISGALDWVYDFLDMHSPSRVFKKIGQFMMDGATIGVAARADQFIGTVGDAAKRAVDVFNPNLDAGGIIGDLSDVDARLVSNVAHKHQIEEQPNQRLVRVELQLNNDALAAIVNGINADNDATFEF